MPAWLAPAIGAAVGLFGGERSNYINQREAQKNRQFQADQAYMNRQFQERMRNTEWQAAVADMHAAGINPAVAYSKGGASSPSGSMPGGATAAGALDSVSSAFQAAMQQKQLRLLDTQIRKTKAEGDTATAQAILERATQNFLTNVEGDGKAPLRRQLSAAIEGAEATNELTRNRAAILGPQSEIMSTIEDALRPILGTLSNWGGRAMNNLRQSK